VSADIAVMPVAEKLADRLVLSVTEAASLLGISRALAYQLVARDELPNLRLGRRVVVPTRRLLELVAGGSLPTPGELGPAAGARRAI
jgi:excisionase family DNA binding protein